MIKLETILVPVDFSERSLAAAEHAAAMAKHHGSKLIFMHVIPPAPYQHATFEGGYHTAAMWPWDTQVEAFCNKQLNELMEKTTAGLDAEKVLLKGDPAGKIVELVPERSVDMIMMPTHGYGPFRRFILGSVASKVLHDATCPVFTGAHVAELAPFNTEPYKRIACAVDLREHSETVLRWAWDFAKAWTEDLIMIHAAPQLEIGSSFGDWCPTDTRHMLIRAAREKLDKLMETVGCKAEVHIETADPVHYVPDAASNAYADVLVIGRSPDRGVMGRLRTHAQGLIRGAHSPVISV